MIHYSDKIYAIQASLDINRFADLEPHKRLGYVKSNLAGYYNLSCVDTYGLHNLLCRKGGIKEVPLEEFTKIVSPRIYKRFISTRGMALYELSIMEYLSLDGVVKRCVDCNTPVRYTHRVGEPRCRDCGRKYVAAQSHISQENRRKANVVSSDASMLEHLKEFYTEIRVLGRTQWQEYKVKFPVGYARMKSYFSSSMFPITETRNTKSVLEFYLSGKRVTCTVCGTPSLIAENHPGCITPELRAKMVANGSFGNGDLEVEKKRRASMRARYGVDYAMQSPALKKKLEASLLSKYGVSSSWNTPNAEAKRNTHDQVAASIKGNATKKLRYGENALVDQALHMSQTRYKFTKVKLPGCTLNLQGYEPQVARFLVETVPGIVFSPNRKYLPYYDSSTRKNRKYVPDFLVKTPNGIRIVEVKSTFTLGLTSTNLKTYWANLKDKAKGTLSSTGYPLDLVVYSPKLGPVLLQNVSQTWTRSGAIKFLMGLGYLK